MTPSTTGEQSPKPRISIVPILSINFVGTLGFSIVLPFLVFLVTRWGGNALVYGVMGATYSAFQLIGAPILGRWSDVYGRRKILLLSQLGTLVSWVIFVIAFALPTTTLLDVDSSVLGTFTLSLPLLVLFLARALDGITGGNVSVASAYLADITEEEHRNAAFGKMSVSSNLGFIVGPALAGLLGSTLGGELPPVLAALGISVIATVLIITKLPDSRPCVLHRDPGPPSVRKVFGQESKECFELATKKLPLVDLFRLPHMSVLLSINFLVLLGFNFFYIAFPVYAVEGLEWAVKDTGVFFAVLSLMMVLVQGPLLARLAGRVPDGVLVVGGNLVLAVSFVFFASHDPVLLYAGAALMALGNGVMWPSVVSLLSKAAGPEYQGTVQGFAGSAGAVASILGLVVGGMLYGRLEAITFTVAAGVILVAFLLSLRLLVTAPRS